METTKRDLLTAFERVWGVQPMEVVEELLFSTTSFPFSPVEKLEVQLKEYHDRSGGNPGLAVKLAYEDFDKAWEEYKARENEDGESC